MKDLSIIVPVYNTSKYLQKCILSCLQQDIPYEKYEIVCVNDGSTDDSLKLLNELHEQYPNVKVISQKNGGLSSARNTGLRNAEGEYVWFVDSDDWIQQNCLGYMIELCKKNNLDGLYFKYVRKDENGNTLPCELEKWYDFSKFSTTVISGQDALIREEMIAMGVLTIFKQKVLIDNNLFFSPGIYHEDTEFIPRAYYYLNRVQFINLAPYNYLVNMNSIMTVVNPKHSDDLLIVANHIHDFMSGVRKECYLPYHRIITTCLNNAMRYALKREKEGRDKFNNLMLHNRYLYKSIWLSNKIHYKLEYVLMCIFPHRSVQVFSFLKKIHG
jgi:glycosyltransferase involved in cell wall biosynthesis